MEAIGEEAETEEERKEYNADKINFVVNYKLIFSRQCFKLYSTHKGSCLRRDC